MALRASLRASDNLTIFFVFELTYLLFSLVKMASTEEDDPNRFIKLNPALDVDLDEIDDKEFDIPRIDKPPTLESILNAPDEDLPIADNCIVDATLQVCDTPTSRLLYNMSVRQQYFFRVMIK